MDTTKNSQDEKILETARQRFDLAVEAEAENRKEALEDIEFRAGKQWPDEIKAQRDLQSRPCITINRIPQFIRQVTNDQRQNRPAIKVSPVDDSADIETAKIIQGIIRHIEYNSNAEVAYDTSFEGAATNGFGFFRLKTEYVSPMSFEQEVLIKKIDNNFSVYLDPYAIEPDGSDAQWGFIFEKLSPEDYKKQYGGDDGETLSSMTDWASMGDRTNGWVNDNSVRVAEYFYKEYEEKDIVQLENGQVMLKSDYEDFIKRHGADDDTAIKDERKARFTTVHSCKINSVDILERSVWPGTFIPIIPVYGDILNVDGKRIYEGMVRHAKDPQRMLNYWKSAETETITLAPKAPYIAAEGQTENHENEWATANTANHSVLLYKPTSIAGHQVPMPSRNVQEPPVMAITNAVMQSADDLKATTGVYDAAMGARSNETSGVAIRNRASQTQTSNFHYIDNLTRSLRHCGRILVEIIPTIYDTARTIRIIGADDKEEMVKINQYFEKKGEQVNYKMSAGKYDVAVDTGPSYATKRQESADSMLELSKVMPQINEVAADLLVKSLDIPAGQEISERLEKTLPPGMIDKEDEGQQMPPEMQQMLQQSQQQMQEMQQALQEQQKIIDEKQIEQDTKQMELESRERVEYAKLEADLKKTVYQAEAKEQDTILQGEIDQLNQKQKSLGELNRQDVTGDRAPE